MDYSEKLVNFLYSYFHDDSDADFEDWCGALDRDDFNGMASPCATYLARTLKSIPINGNDQEVAETSRILVDKNGPKCIKYYNSSHKILLVGEGDFSFSACLAKAFGSSATNMVATSLDSYGFILQHYGTSSLLNIYNLEKNGCKVIHGVDATTMAFRADFVSMTFDRIVFNFPHAGFNKSESRHLQLQRHRNLVIGFFVNSKRMLSITGEIHVVHKTNGFFSEWRIEELAAQCGLRTVEKIAFNLHEYPGYQNKYGFGGNKNFNCNPSMTYKFGLQICNI